MPYLPENTPMPPHSGNPSIRPVLRSFARVTRTLNSIDKRRNLQNQLDQPRTLCNPNYSQWQLDAKGNPIVPPVAVPAEFVALAAERGIPGLTAAQLQEVAEAPQMVNESEIKPCIPIVKDAPVSPGSMSAPPWGNVQANPRGQETPVLAASSSWLAENWGIAVLAIFGAIALKSVFDEGGRS